MKKVIAFLTALVLTLTTILGMHCYTTKNLCFNNPAFAYWTAKEKFKAPAVIRDNLNKDTLVVFASSELEHGKKTPYHPQNLFKGNQFRTMLIGSGHYQSLSHAITLAALEPAMEKRKVVLMVSPQWFRKEGIVPKAFASRFSESSFIDMLKNDKLSTKTKLHLADRSLALLNDDPQMQKRIRYYRNQLLGKKTNPLSTMKYSIYSAFLDDKQKQSMLTLATAANIIPLSNPHSSTLEPDWNKYLDMAAIDAKKATSSNDFQISNDYYKWKIEPQLDMRKGSSNISSYSDSPEYGDLQYFLDVCKDLNIEPMLILLPVNGRWYDYTDFPKGRRDEFYQKVQTLAKKYPEAKVADLSSDDYTDYFMQDTIHIGWKGWVSVDEILYKFGN
ncbi:MAG: D-alanyl-lipoteichoic acid biosynthesis protein DltD [Lachnospiraceae bacterium]